MSIGISNDKDDKSLDFGGARPSPGTDVRPRGCSSDSGHLILRHAPMKPVCLTGHGSLLLQPIGRGVDFGGAVGDGHPDYASSYGLFTLDTKQNDKEYRATANKKAALVEDASRVLFVISFQEVSRAPPVAHVTWWFGPIGWQSLSWAERKEEGKKIYFPCAIFNLATLKLVIICRVLCNIKVNSFYGSYGESFCKA